jgi:class 3 adenylate cyclase
VTANGTLDYFGQTVNCASRVQHLADSGQIVLEESVFELLPEAVRAELSIVETVEVRVKGVEHPLRLVKTRLSDEKAKSGGDVKTAGRNVAEVA